jgi:hypothetical protein
MTARQNPHESAPDTDWTHPAIGRLLHEMTLPMELGDPTAVNTSTISVDDARTTHANAVAADFEHLDPPVSGGMATLGSSGYRRQRTRRHSWTSHR